MKKNSPQLLLSPYDKNTEKERILQALQTAHHNKARAARLLGIDRKTPTTKSSSTIFHNKSVEFFPTHPHIPHVRFWPHAILNTKKSFIINTYNLLSFSGTPLVH